MNALDLARWQFGITTVYHFFFVPLSIGLSLLVAIMQTFYFATEQDVYKRMTKFWGKFLLINFAIGVATGIVQEFQFGMNWSEYSRFVGDVFGAPLAIEALTAFFLESTFLGLWLFGWDKLPKLAHLASIWLVAIGTMISSIWILAANSFMQQPVGYAMANGRAQMTDFFALVANGHLWVQFPHVLTAAMTTGAFFVLAISAYHLLEKHDAPVRDLFQRSFRIAMVYALIGTIGVIVAGDAQARYMFKVQPMKMAAAEALGETQTPAPMSLFTIGNRPEQRDLFVVQIPGLLSFMACGDFNCTVEGLKNLQQDFQQRYGPGDYQPVAWITYWTFRAMIGAGLAMLLLCLAGTYLVIRNRFERRRLLLRLLVPAVALPYIANATGWIFTEMGRQPWVVYGLLKTANAVSPNVPAGSVLTSVIGFTVVYLVLIVVTVYLMLRFARGAPEDAEVAGAEEVAAPRVPDLGTSQA